MGVLGVGCCLKLEEEGGAYVIGGIPCIMRPASCRYLTRDRSCSLGVESGLRLGTSAPSSHEDK